jgi:hypothetical protein
LGPVRLTAETGNVYYFEVKSSLSLQKTKNEVSQELPVMAEAQQGDPRESGTLPTDARDGLGSVIPDLSFAQLDEDDGKARVKASAHSTFQPKK